MKILALDASGQVASIALAEDDKLLGEYTMNTKKNGVRFAVDITF